MRTREAAWAALVHYQSGIDAHGNLTGEGPLAFPAPDTNKRDAGRRLAHAIADLLAEHDALIAEMNQRELHHFEVEQLLTKHGIDPDAGVNP